MIMDPKAHAEAVETVMKMDGKELLSYLDGLYVRGNLPRSCTIEDIRAEALAQTERHYGPDYERVMRNRKSAFAAALVRGRGEQTEEDAEDE